MAFAVEDVEALLRVLRENPEWREGVRREVLGEELLKLPELVRQTAEAVEKAAGDGVALVATMEEEFRRVDAAAGTIAPARRTLSASRN